MRVSAVWGIRYAHEQYRDMASDSEHEAQGEEHAVGEVE